MNETYLFRPERKSGVVFHAGAILVTFGIAAWGLWKATGAEVGPEFLLYVAPVLLSTVLLPWLVYRLHVLLNAVYLLERDGIRIRWGIRQEDIPIDQVVWMRPQGELNVSLPLPWFSWPGSVVGKRNLGNNEVVEYFSTRTKNLLLIAIPGKIFAVSPAEPGVFLHQYTELSELGSLAPIQAHSRYANFILARLWDDRLARSLLLAGLGLNLLLVAWTIAIIPQYPGVPLRLYPASAPIERVPSIQLLLLPLLSLMFFAADLFFGLFFFRKTESNAVWDRSRALAYVCWGCDVFACLVFLGGIVFILKAV